MYLSRLSANEPNHIWAKTLHHMKMLQWATYRVFFLRKFNLCFCCFQLNSPRMYLPCRKLLRLLCKMKFVISTYFSYWFSNIFICILSSKTFKQYYSFIILQNDEKLLLKVMAKTICEHSVNRFLNCSAAMHCNVTASPCMLQGIREILSGLIL